MYFAGPRCISTTVIQTGNPAWRQDALVQPEWISRIELAGHVYRITARWDKAFTLSHKILF
jgi:hypothetical protein